MTIVINLNEKQMLTKVLRHFAKQGHRSVDKLGNCKYRAPNGDRCAIGVFIKDSDYKTEMEGLGLTAEFEFPKLTSSYFAEKLQELHDYSETEFSLKESARNLNWEFEVMEDDELEKLLSKIKDWS